MWAWACEILIKTLLITNQQLNEAGFTWHPAVLRVTKGVEVFSHYGEFYLVSEGINLVHDHLGGQGANACNESDALS